MSSTPNTTRTAGQLQVERLLQICVAMLVVLSTLMRTLGQREPHMPVLALAAAGLSIYLTDIKGWIRLPRIASNLVAIVTVGLALRGFFQMESEAQLMAIGDILAYLQMVLLFQEKYARLYWQLIMLSLLQVVVGAAINASVFFGVLLLMFMFVALAVLTLFFLVREAGRENSNAEPESDSKRQPTEKRRWPLPVGAAPFAAVAPPAAQNEPAGWSAVRQAAWMGLTTLLFSAALFVVMPRIGQSNWSEAVGAVQPITGFSPRVKLRDSGPLIQNSQLVMRVQLVNENDAPVVLNELPLFRGSVLNEYSRGEWRYRPPPQIRDQERRLPSSTSASGIVWQHIQIEPLTDPIVFAMYPPVVTSQTNNVSFSSAQLVLFRPREGHKTAAELVIGTTGIRQGRLWPLVPILGTADDPRYFLPRSGRQNAEPLEMSEITNRILANANVAAGDRVAAAEALVKQFQDPTQFEYTVESQPRDRALDPSVDFLTNNRRGHCEYFASALCLMLRSLGMPARVVVGYRGDWDAATESYEVRQFHAHAWVEVFLNEDQIPESLKYTGGDFSRGGWLTLDPTPAGATELAEAKGFFAPLQPYIDSAQSFWNNYVLGMTGQRQQELIYDPVEMAIAQGAKAAFAWTSETPRIFWQWLRGGWWQPAMTFGGIVLVLAATFQFIRVMGRWNSQRRAHRRRGRNGKPQAATVDFYRRLEKLLARHGLVRAAGETQREFAASVIPQLAAAGGERSPAGLPRRIVDAFYRVRFGGRQLDAAEQQSLDEALSSLEHSLAARR